MITSFFKPKQESKSKTSQEARKRTSDPTETTDKRLKTDSVEVLLVHLDASWQSALQKHCSSPIFANLAKFVDRERQTKTVYPPVEQTFAALNLCAIDRIKVVIVGQDPYHGPNQAHGLCFSVQRGQAVPPSLKNIYKELLDDAVDFTIPRHGCLERWAKQGVLLLNTVLTVVQGQANSHQKRGWESTTDQILAAVDRASRQRGQGVVFLLWGRPAMAKASTVVRKDGFHTVISTSHPSPLGARKTSSPFLGSHCFSRCNTALIEKGHAPIDWNVDGPL